jgi:hypothetical protein
MPAVAAALRGQDLGGEARVARRARTDAKGVGEGLRGLTVAEARARPSGVMACIKQMRGSGRNGASADRPIRRKPSPVQARWKCPRCSGKTLGEDCSHQRGIG